MFKFIRLFNKKLDKECGWYCLIRNNMELFLWYTNSGIRTRIATAAQHLVKSYEFGKLCGQYNGGGHITNPLALVTYNHIKQDAIKAETERKWTIFDISNYMHELMCSKKLEAIERGKQILTNSNDGWFCMNENYSILETVTSDSYLFPTATERDIKISQWPNGKHYYVKVGEVDVVDEVGNMKWDSYKEAKRQAKKFIANNE